LNFTGGRRSRFNLLL